MKSRGARLALVALAVGWLTVAATVREVAAQDAIEQMIQFEETVSLAPTGAAAAPVEPARPPAPAAEPAAATAAVAEVEAAAPLPAAEPEAPPTAAETWLKASNADLMQALAMKEEQLQAARAEIEQLKDLTRRIWEANRRERINAYYNMGCVYKACKLPKEAEKQFLKALEIDPADAGVHYNLGILYDEDLKNRTKARQQYQLFLELAPDDRDAPRVREWLLAAEIGVR